MCEKKLNLVKKPLKFTVRLFLLFPLLLLASCSTTNIASLDRILFPKSTAKVGPLIAVDEEYPINNDVVKNSKGQSVTESLGEFKDNTQSNTIEAQNTESKAINGAVSSDVVIGLEANDFATPSVNDELVKPSENKTQVINSISVPQLEINNDVVSSSKGEPAKPNRLSKKAIQNPTVIPKVNENEEIKIDQGTVTGQVVLVADDGKFLSAEGTLITLMPKETSGGVPNNNTKTHVIDMEDKEYQPRYSTINVGDQVVFVNKDNIQHNVFSSSGSNAFDLGTYGSGLKRAVTLTEPGIVKIYCNIHADMATFVAVSDPGLSVEADKQGRYKIDEVPLGTYEMVIWNIRGETKRIVEVIDKKTIQMIDRIDTSNVKAESHKNKFGGNYSKNAALFEDEFY